MNAAITLFNKPNFYLGAKLHFLVNISAWLNWQKGISEALCAGLLLMPLEQYVGHSSLCLLTESIH